MFDTLSRYILRRTTARFFLLFAVFMGVLVGGQVALLLGRGVPPEVCLPIIQALSLLSIPVALPISLATAILVVIGGMVQDGEFRALASSGVGHRRVLVRLIPLIIGAVVLCGVLTHVVMPLGIKDMRANKGKLLQAAIASRVAEGEAMIEGKDLHEEDMSIWATAADGPRLQEVRLMRIRGKEVTAVYAPEARWVLTKKGIHLECQNVQMMVRSPGKHLISLDTDRYSHLFENELTNRDHLEPDAMSTSEVMALAKKVPLPNESQSDYNNARLTVQFRFFLPVSLIAFSLLAMGLGLTFGTDQNLPGVIIIVVVVAAVVYPTFGYVKNYTNLPQINPAFILWPPGIVVALFGGWMAWRPERAREILTFSMAWLSSRRTKNA